MLFRGLGTGRVLDSFLLSRAVSPADYTNTRRLDCQLYKVPTIVLHQFLQQRKKKLFTVKDDSHEVRMRWHQAFLFGVNSLYLASLSRCECDFSREERKETSRQTSSTLNQPLRTSTSFLLSFTHSVVSSACCLVASRCSS
jgi:hypothetical protein